MLLQAAAAEAAVLYRGRGGRADGCVAARAARAGCGAQGEEVRGEVEARGDRVGAIMAVRSP